MESGAIGMLVLAGLCIVCPVIANAYLRNFGFATFISVVSIVVLFQVAAFLQLGYLDAYWLIAVVTTTAIALPVSLVLGALVRRVRESRESSDAPT